MSNTTNLNLFKHDNPSTNTNPFDIEASLNENWDKIDAYAGNTNTAITTNENNIEALQQENARLKATLPTTSETGENITLNKTAELDFVVPPLPIGNTVQDGEPTPTNPVEVQVVKGDVEVLIRNKNLFNTEWEQGYININGENENSSDFIRTKDYIYFEPEQKYAIQRSIATAYTNVRGYDKNKRFVGTGSNVIVSYSGGADNLMQATIQTCVIATKPGVYYLRFNDASNNLSTEYMMEKGDKSSDYTPHKEQKLPLYLPVENLCPTKSFNSIPTARIVSNVAGGGSVPGISVKAGTYTASFDVTTLPSIDYRMQLVASSDSTQIQSGSDLINRTKAEAISCTSLGRYKITISVTESCYLYLRCVPSGFVLDNIQIEPGLKANHYTPFGTTPIELCKIGIYQDYFYKSGSKWYLHKEIEKIILNGTENWNVSSGTGFYRFILTNNNFKNDANLAAKNVLMSNIFKSTSFNARNTDYNETCYQTSNGATSGAGMGINTNIASTVNDFKTWLASNNVTVYYVLATATDTEITDTTLRSQLEAIYNAISYYEQTNISGTSSGINPLFDVEAYQNTKLLLEDIINSN